MSIRSAPGATSSRRIVRKPRSQSHQGRAAVWQARSKRWPERGLRYLATRFSAKEAFSKAIGTGIHQPMSWRACEILNHPSGQPYIRLHGELKTWFEGQGLRAHVTLTDESDYAASFVVVEKVSAMPAELPNY